MAQMYAGLDVSQKKTSICVVDRRGRILFEGEATTSPACIAAGLKPYKACLERVGLETGPLSNWLHRELLQRRFKVICMDARRIGAALAAQRNKTDRNDAREIAKLLSRGYAASVHVKGDTAQHQRLLLRARGALHGKARELKATIQSTLVSLGYALDDARRAKTGDLPKKLNGLARDALSALSHASEVVEQEATRLDQTIQRLTKTDPVCKRLMTVPGVGPLTALTFKATIEDPARFANSRAVGAYIGLTPKRFQSGQSDWQGGISKRGDGQARQALYLAAHSLICKCTQSSRLRTWALRLKRDKGHQRACTACARKLAVLLHAMWLKEKDFEPL